MSLNPRNTSRLAASAAAALLLGLSQLGDTRSGEESLAAREGAATRVRAISANVTRRYAIELPASEYVRVAVDRQGVDVAATLLSPDGATLARIDFRQPDAVELSAVTHVDGTHLLDIRSLDPPPASGRYAVRVEEIHRAGPFDWDRTVAAKTLAEADALAADWHADAADRTLALYRDALSRFEATHDVRGEAKATRRLGETHLALGKPDEALPLLLAAERLARTAGDSDGVCAAIEGAARVSLALGKMADAKSFADRALQSSRDGRHRARQVDALNAQGDIDAFSGRTRQSLDRYREALAIATELLDVRRQAHARLNLGYSHSDLSQVVEALGQRETALALSRAVDDKRGEAAALTALGQLHGIVGENDRALAYFRQAMPIHERLGDQVGLGSTLLGIALVHFRSRDLESAVAYQVRAADLFKSVKQRSGEATSLLNLGRSLAGLRRYDEALETYSGALKLFQSLADRRLQTRVLVAIADVHAELGQADKALAEYQASRAAARDVGDSRAEVSTLNAIGALLFTRGRYHDARGYLNEALRLGERSQSSRFAESQVLYNLARTEAALGNLDAAMTRIRASLNIVETLRADASSLDLRASYIASVRDRQELEIDLLMRRHAPRGGDAQVALAFEASERARARTLLDALAQARAGIREGVAPALVEREATIRRTLNASAQRMTQLKDDAAHADEISALRVELDTQTVAYKEVEAQIQAESPRYAALMQPRPLKLAQVQELIADDSTVLLQYFLGAERSFVWAVTRDRITARVLPARGEIERRVTSYRDLIAVPVRGAASSVSQAARARSIGGLAVHRNASHVEKLAQDVSRMLLAPVAGELAKPRIVVVADGILHAIPFAALPMPRSDDSTQPAVPLVADHDVVNLPSASTLALLRGDWVQQPRWQKAALVFADPVYERDDPRLGVTDSNPRLLAEAQAPETRAVGGIRISRLVQTRHEARRIAALASPADVALDFEASRTTATSSNLADYKIVHFAAHGIVDDRHPELSGIVLSLFDKKGQLQDGFLRLHDIYNLKVPADLVVLSACGTALGKEVVGEGLIGLVRGFMYAGTRRVVASLWEVDDEATSELMARFYRGMFEKNLAPPAALRAAQNELMADPRWHAPFYWAAFVLQGDWR